MGRRGPKKRTDQKRERNGRLSRQAGEAARRNIDGLDVEQRETLSVGLDARMRRYGASEGREGIKPTQARDQMAGSVIGRWCLIGRISHAHYDAAMLFLEAHARNLLAIDAPPLPGAVDLNATHGRPVHVENPDQLRKWRLAYKAATDAIQEKQNEIRLMGNLFGSLYAVVIRDTDLEHAAGDVRVALNALVRHYGLEARAAA